MTGLPGRRRYLDENGELWLDEGEYGRTSNGEWLARPPGGHAGSLRNHDVTEHTDGSITVTPSILIYDADSRWHGYLRAGKWYVSND